MKRDKLSVCITACNEEDKIRNCLRSVAWADEIVVVDSYSKDNTIRICREFTDRVYQHKWLGYIGQKNLVKKMAQHPWILFIDADEEVSTELRNQILHQFESGHNRQFEGYEFPRKVRYMGRWIKHGEWYPDYKMRLFRKDRGICAGKEPHDRITVPGKVRRLKGDLYHYTYANIHEQLETLNKFSTITARDKFNSGVRFRWIDLLFRPVYRFFKSYLLKLGFLDGAQGFVIAVCSSYGVFIKYAKLMELWHANRPTSDGIRHDHEKQ